MNPTDSAPDGGREALLVADIHRLLDGELPPARAAEVAAWIAADPQRTRQADAWRRQRALLHERYDSLLTEPIPPAMLQTLSTAPTTRAYARAALQSLWLRAAGIVLLAGACGSAGWFGHARLGNPQAPDALTALSQRAAMAHAVFSPEVRHPVEVTASEELHLVRWLSARLATPVRAPVLIPQGYALVGGRLLPGEDRPVAQFMYQNGAGKRLTLYVSTLTPGSPSLRETAFRFERFRNVNTFYWVENTRAYALSGDLTREELMPVARTVYEQLAKSMPEPAQGVQPAKAQP